MRRMVEIERWTCMGMVLCLLFVLGFAAGRTSALHGQEPQKTQRPQQPKPRPEPPAEHELPKEPVPRLYTSFTVRAVVNVRAPQDAQWVRERFKAINASLVALDEQVREISLIRVCGVYTKKGEVKTTELWKEK